MMFSLAYNHLKLTLWYHFFLEKLRILQRATETGGSDDTGKVFPIIWELQLVSITNADWTYHGASNGNRTEEAAGGKLAFAWFLGNLVHFLPNQMQTDICGAGTCGFCIAMSCNVLTQSEAGSGREHRRTLLQRCPSYDFWGWGWMYVPQQPRHAWFLWRLMRFPFEVTRGQNWQSPPTTRR